MTGGQKQINGIRQSEFQSLKNKFKADSNVGNKEWDNDKILKERVEYLKKEEGGFK